MMYNGGHPNAMPPGDARAPHMQTMAQGGGAYPQNAQVCFWQTTVSYFAAADAPCPVSAADGGARSDGGAGRRAAVVRGICGHGTYGHDAAATAGKFFSAPDGIFAAACVDAERL